MRVDSSGIPPWWGTMKERATLETPVLWATVLSGGRYLPFRGNRRKCPDNIRESHPTEIIFYYQTAHRDIMNVYQYPRLEPGGTAGDPQWWTVYVESFKSNRKPPKEKRRERGA